MGRVSSTRRSLKINQAQKRQDKLTRLRQKWLKVRTLEEKEKIWRKVQKVSPGLSQEIFLSTTDKS